MRNTRKNRGDNFSKSRHSRCLSNLPPQNTPSRTYHHFFVAPFGLFSLDHNISTFFNRLNLCHDVTMISLNHSFRLKLSLDQCSSFLSSKIRIPNFLRIFKHHYHFFWRGRLVIIFASLYFSNLCLTVRVLLYFFEIIVPRVSLNLSDSLNNYSLVLSELEFFRRLPLARVFPARGNDFSSLYQSFAIFSARR